MCKLGYILDIRVATVNYLGKITNIQIQACIKMNVYVSPTTIRTLFICIHVPESSHGFLIMKYPKAISEYHYI